MIFKNIDMPNKKTEEAEDFLNLGIVINENGEILMIRRVQSEKGKDGSVLTWAFPGGKQRLNESRKECVKRTILSETGYSVESIREISMGWHPQFPIFAVFHSCRLIGPNPVFEPSEPHEVAEIRWVRPEDIKKLITTDLDPKVAKELKIDK